MGDQLVTIPKENIMNKVGELSNKQMLDVELAIMCSLDLSRHSIANIQNLNLKSIITKKTKESEVSTLVFELIYMNGYKQNIAEIEILLSDATEYNQEITKDTDLNKIQSLFDCCSGLNFLINHSIM
jgi:hypothetical protein